MPLIRCVDCGKEVSSRAVACPNCGAPVEIIAEAEAVGLQLTTTQRTSKKQKVTSGPTHSTFASGFLWRLLAIGYGILTAACIWPFFVFSSMFVWSHGFPIPGAYSDADPRASVGIYSIYLGSVVIAGTAIFYYAYVSVVDHDRRLMLRAGLTAGALLLTSVALSYLTYTGVTLP